MSEKRREKIRGEPCKHLFKYLNPPLLEKLFLVSNVKNYVKRCSVEEFHMFTVFVRLCSPILEAK